MSYIFTDKAVTNFTYYAMALYANSYGMTDRRKAEYRISLEITSVDNSTATTSNVIVSESDTLQVNT